MDRGGWEACGAFSLSTAKMERGRPKRREKGGWWEGRGGEGGSSVA